MTLLFAPVPEGKDLPEGVDLTAHDMAHFRDWRQEEMKKIEKNGEFSHGKSVYGPD